ncbi:MAG: hypothetical protein LUH58_09390 [Lachnospiraceae bacterium]|nr:hypothetical protein [Lachnospiraceae bacterium]
MMRLYKAEKISDERHKIIQSHHHNGGIVMAQDSIEKGFRKMILAGIGAAAITAEKSKELLDKLAQRGELAVEQGKAINEELKHNKKSKDRE